MSEAVKVYTTDEPPRKPKDGYHWIQATNLKGELGWVEVHEQIFKTTSALRQKKSYWRLDKIDEE